MLSVIHRFPRASSVAVIVLGLMAVAPRLAAQITEVPATVAPGRFLFEADLMSLQIDREGEEKYSALGLGSVLVTTGLTERLDLQVGADIFITQKYESEGFSDRHSGVGDLYFRAKWRFYESEESAAAVIPYLKLPTNSGHVGNEAVEGGVIVPYETKLTGGFFFNAQAGLDLLRNADDSAYDMNWSGAVTVSRSLTSRISVYGEFIGAKSSGVSGWIGTMGGGVYLTLSDRVSWDFAVYRGLSRAATDWNPVVRLNMSF
jgi:hypothetical protein